MEILHRWMSIKLRVSELLFFFLVFIYVIRKPLSVVDLTGLLKAVLCGCFGCLTCIEKTQWYENKVQ